MSVNIRPGRAIVKYNEVSDAALPTVEFSEGSFYITPTGHMYLDSFATGKRIHIGGPATVDGMADFNTYTTSGRYLVNNVECDNAPIAAKGLLEVMGDNNMIIQRYTTVAGVVYTRGGFNQVGIIDWNPWKRVGEQ